MMRIVPILQVCHVFYNRNDASDNIGIQEKALFVWV